METVPLPAVELRGLVKSYGSVQAVRGVDITIEAGQTVALLGPNGAGKSTTIDMLLGLSKPDAGTVSLFGQSPADAAAAGRIGAMLQSGAAVRDLSVRELVDMVASLYPAPLGVDEVIDLVGLREVADRRTQKLSGGQTQRVRAALALVADPALLVLDEPTAALDVEGRRDFWRVMRNAASAGKTIVFATHYLEEADAYADRVVLMAHGVVVADGATTEIKALVGRRTIRATLPTVAAPELAALAGAPTVERHGDAVTLTCNDSDATLRDLLARYPDAVDIEVLGAGLEEAFVELTTDNPQEVLQ
jgi:ABC-2 type transport system ATP-binding protein